MAGSVRQDRFGRGLAVPVQMGSNGLVTVRGMDLLATHVLMTLSIHKGELRYDGSKGTKIRELKHHKIVGIMRAIANRLVAEVLTREEPRIRAGRVTVEKNGSSLKILVPWTERRYDGTGGPQVTELEV